MKNADLATLASFGDEWTNYDQSKVSRSELYRIFQSYFELFPWESLPTSAVGFDMGCGSGRWAYFVAPKVGRLNCVEPSRAIFSAKKLLANYSNICFIHKELDSSGLEPSSQDFGYCLGVIHHMPSPEQALRTIHSLLKPNAPFLLYVYPSITEYPLHMFIIWSISNYIRYFVSNLSPFFKSNICFLFAFFVYLPLARFSKFLLLIGIPKSLILRNVPLSAYANNSFLTMLTDSRDRFGTPLECRFTKQDIVNLLHSTGFTDLNFSHNVSGHVVVCRKA